MVLGDIIELSPGTRSSTASRRGGKLETDESLLTGQRPTRLPKTLAIPRMSGSSCRSGAGAYRATKVGSEAYAAKLAAEASVQALLVKLNCATASTGFCVHHYLLVLAGLLTTPSCSPHTWMAGIQSRMVGALVPMVPEGLVLMTSDRLRRRGGQAAVSMPGARVARHRGRGWTWSGADKTGTLTESGMRVCEVEELDGAGRQSAADAGCPTPPTPVPTRACRQSP